MSAKGRNHNAHDNERHAGRYWPDACGAALRRARQELTIFWAEWDPANYLQELVNEYTRRNRRQGHRRNGALAGLPDQGLHRVQRSGLRLRPRRRRQPVARCRFDGRSLRRADRLRQGAQPDPDDGSGHHEVLLGISRQFGQVLVGAAGRRRRGLGLPQGLVRGSDRDGQFQGQVRLRPRRAQGPASNSCDIAEFFNRPGREPLRRRRSTRRARATPSPWASRTSCSRYGGSTWRLRHLQGRRAC